MVMIIKLIELVKPRTNEVASSKFFLFATSWHVCQGAELWISSGKITGELKCVKLDIEKIVVGINYNLHEYIGVSYTILYSLF